MADTVAKRPQTDLAREAIRKIGSAITTPLTDIPSRLAKKVSDKISPPNQVGSPMQGFFSGATEGAGDLLTSMTSPLGLATSAYGSGVLGMAPSLIRAAKTAKIASKGMRGPNPALMQPAGTVRPTPTGRMPGQSGRTSNSTVYHGLEPQTPAPYVSNPVAPLSEAYRKGGAIKGQSSRGAELADKMSKLKTARAEAAIKEGRK